MNTKSQINYPLITVTICTYNGERYLGETLDSVLAQTYENMEVIVVDDGSRDKTLSIVEKYASQDSRIKVFPRKNSGLAASRNFAFSKANGEWIAIIDQDDLCYPERLKRQFEVANKYPSAGLIFCNTDYINGEGRIIGNHLSRFKLPEAFIPKCKASNLLLSQGCYIDSEACFVRKTCVDRAGLLNVTLRYACDYEYFIKVGFSTDFAYSSETLSAWRIHDNQETATNNDRFRETRQVLINNILHPYISLKTRFVIVVQYGKSFLVEIIIKTRKWFKRKG